MRDFDLLYHCSKSTTYCQAKRSDNWIILNRVGCVEGVCFQILKWNEQSSDAKLQVARGQCTVSKPVHTLPDANYAHCLMQTMHTVGIKYAHCTVPDANYAHCLIQTIHTT